MRAIIRASVGIAVLVMGLGPVWADDEHHPEKTGTPAKAPVVKTEDKGTAMPNMPMMQEHMQQMQQQMEKILRSKDPAEKDKLMQAMLDHMKMMQAMMNGGMTMGGGMPPQMLEQRLKMMEQRLDQMQMMLDKSRSPAEKK